MIGLEKFKQIRRSKFIGNQLVNAKDKNMECLIWRFLGQKKIVAKVNLDVVKRNSKEIIISASKDNQEEFEQVIGGSYQVNFYIPAMAILFQTELKSHTQNKKVLLAFPKMFAQFERRKNLRIVSYHDQRVDVEFSKNQVEHKHQAQHFKKSCYDLSAGGLSFLASKAELKFFSPRDKISELKLQIADRIFKMDCKINSINELTPDDVNDLVYKAWKVSVEFASLSNEDQEFISKFVFENYNGDFLAS